MEFIDVIAGDPLPEDLPIPGDLDNAVVFERRGSHVRPIMVRMGQQQGIAAGETGCGVRRVVTRGKILTLPIMVLPRGPDHFAVAGLDLLVMVETPELLAVEIALHELGRFLARGIGAGRSYDDTAGKDACRTTGGTIVAIPLLDDVAVHVDDDRGLSTQRREHRITVPGKGRIIDRRAGWKDGRPRQKDCRCRGQHRAGNSSHRPSSSESPYKLVSFGLCGLMYMIRGVKACCNGTATIETLVTDPARAYRSSRHLNVIPESC